MSISENWKSENLPERQLEIVKNELAFLNGDLECKKFHKGAVVWKALADAVENCIPESNLQLMEIGCASGYYVDIFDHFLNGKFIYSGSDFSEAMIKMAQKNYPNNNFKVLDIRNIDLNDKSCEVVFSAAVLEHVPAWKKGLKELIRITDKYLILHKTPVKRTFSKLQKIIYDDVEVCFNTFPRQELLDIVTNSGFELIFDGKTNNNFDNIYRIFIFRRIK